MSTAVSCLLDAYYFTSAVHLLQIVRHRLDLYKAMTNIKLERAL